LAEEVLRYIDWSGPWWRYIDWLLIGIFFFMSLVIMVRANLRVDALILFVGTCGGLVIESWGTQTNLWFYYTSERPPLWIIPAWPIASLCIDRLTQLLKYITTRCSSKKPGGIPIAQFLNVHTIYWLIFGSFYILMLAFVAPTFDHSFTKAALLLCTFIIFTPTNKWIACLTFLAGSGLGYFLELWGTTRQCWTYYTYQTPPLFAVLAHGMAAVAFWRAGLLLRALIHKYREVRGAQVRSPLPRVLMDILVSSSEINKKRKDPGNCRKEE
jgi:hypothetical protein